MAQAGVQQRILAAEHLEIHVAGAADELRGLGDIAAGVLHTDDVGHIVCQLFHQLCAQGIAHTAGVVVQQHRGLRYALGNGLEVVVQLVIGGLEEHGLQHTYGGGTVLHGHLCQTAALFGADGTDAEVHRHTAGRLIHHDLQAALHLVLFQHIELAVGAECQNAGNAALDDIIHLGALFGLIDFFVLVANGQNGHDNTLDKRCIHL